MVKIILDYKQTTQKSNCKLCKKLILKGKNRVKLEGDNNKYFRDSEYYHIECLINRFNDFKNEIPKNRCEF